MKLKTVLFGIAASGAMAGAANAGELEGRVLNTEGRAIANARVVISGTDMTAMTDSRGHFHVDELPAGEYTITVLTRDGKTTQELVSVPETGVAELTLLFDVQLEEVVVSASPFDRSTLEMAQPVELISGDELEKLKAASIGETLSNQLGVNATYAGPASGRPVIRGLTGNRVRVQQDGISSMDVSALSPDHAVAIEPLLIDAVEIVKGPATLLYGNGAFGGVVNLEDSRIPDEVPMAEITGAIELRGDTAANERTGVIRLDGGSGSFAWHADGFRRKTDDVEIPGHAESEILHAAEGHEDEAGEEGGILENSDIDTRGGALGGSYITDTGFIGLSVSTYDSNYGVPGHAHEEEPAAPAEPAAHEEGVRIDMNQTRYDIKGRLDAPFAGIESMKFRLGANDYEHSEIEDGAVATTFTNDEIDARLEMVHTEVNGWRGAFGLQVHDRDFAAIGDEAYVPPTASRGYGLFLVEEKEFESGRFEIGGRAERQSQDPQGLASRSDTAFSFSTGYVWNAGKSHNIGINLTRAERMPDIEERYSNGPHLATLQFEIGDPSLDTETANNLDLTFKQFGAGITWTVNLFYNRVNDFIYLANTGMEQDGLPVAVYTQNDAVLKGYEAELEAPLWSGDGRQIKLRVFSDHTRGTLVDGGNLPRIPPRRFGAGVDYKSVDWTASLSATRHQDQNDTAPFELPTDGYTMLDASVSYRMFLAHVDWNLFLRATNLLDEEARRHTSFLKDLAPLPGRNFTLGVQAAF